MHACQLLFERQWQFDVDVQHLNRDNMYQIKKEGVKVYLVAIEKEAQAESNTRRATRYFIYHDTIKTEN